MNVYNTYSEYYARDYFHMTVTNYNGAYSLIPQCGFENVTSDDITPLLGPFEYYPGNVTTLLVH